MFVGDALAMPAHWYYEPHALAQDYGTLRDYQAPRRRHPHAIMSRSSTGRAGRGGQESDIVGNFILHGKKELWAEPQLHYHFGLEAGDNTLNLLCTRVLLRKLNDLGEYDADKFVQAYVDFMTTPNSHCDTYAESYHRDFFANYARGVPPRECAGVEGHDTASIGGLVSLPPVTIALAGRGDAASAADDVLTHLRLTHRSGKLERYALAFHGMLLRLLEDSRPDIRDMVRDMGSSLQIPMSRLLERANRKGQSDLEVIGKVFSPACYIDQSFPSVLYLAARYADDFEEALVANANVGGDNCHRGAVLGSLLGAALGVEAIPKRWIEGLRGRGELETEIETFVNRFVPEKLTP